VRDLTSELRRFEGLTSELDDYEVLAWRVDAGNYIKTDRLEVILLWGRTGLVGGSTGWVLVQGFRYLSADRVWRRSLFWRTLKAPLLRVRPGEDRDGTWRAFHRYDHAPTALEMCAFAEVSFLGPDTAAGYRRVAGSLQKRAWVRVTSEEPRCGFATPTAVP
jgi:hypothetical protein